MSAKLILIAVTAIAVSSCADAVKRFAPPGIVKYEELAKGEPVDAAIAARIKERRVADDAAFPILSEQPSETPEAMAKPDRVAMEKLLTERRTITNDAIAADRAEAPSDRVTPLAAQQEAIQAAIEEDRDAAARERAAAIPVP